MFSLADSLYLLELPWDSAYKQLSCMWFFCHSHPSLKGERSCRRCSDQLSVLSGMSGLMARGGSDHTVPLGIH